LALNQLGASLLGLDEPTLPADLEDTLERHTELLPHLLRAVSEKRGAKRLEASVWVDNTSRTLGLTIHTLRRNDGSVRGYLVLFTDLTELRQRAEEERLSESLTQLGQLAAGIAHELRNGLATLRGYLTLIERHPGEESITDYLMEIRRESDHLERVLRDFLVFARPESLQVGDIDLWKLVERVAADPALAAARIEVVNKAPNWPRVRGDEQLLDQVIRNLLRNAVEASDTPSTDKHADVWVTLQQSGEDLDLTIEDCGPGLPQDLEDRLFQPFVSSKSGGVGLGLSIAQRIASLHGLRIRLENREGEGARATLHFPSVTFDT
jgi:signal transduction histidine kinase